MLARVLARYPRAFQLLLADGFYAQAPQAIEAFLLVAFLAYNLFHAFWLLNLKPAVRHRRTQRYWARLMARELCQDTCFAEGSSP